MAYDGKLLARARERLSERRACNAREHARRETETYARIPQLREIDRAMRKLMGQVIRLTASGNANAQALSQVERRGLDLIAQKGELLASRGFPVDYLEEIVSCPICRDRGYRKDGSLCRCLMELYEAERTAELSSALKLSHETFGKFQLDYYEGDARDCMELVLENCQTYATEFGPDSSNLLFQGGTGLGKTFLSSCIAGVVSGRGFSVVYETAQTAFSAFEEQKFSRDAETYAVASEKVGRILSCQLLILDDLGTELTTSFTQSALYHILNTRLTENRKMIISTNLENEELESRYMPQIISRLQGEFATLLFTGRDIRAIRKVQRYQE